MESATDLRCVIIDDEKNSILSLQELIRQFCSNTEVVATANNVANGVKAIREHSPDVVFLDIEMPIENGFKLFDYFDNIEFNVIFTTAYDNYAVKAFKVSALDYLLKPIYLKDLKVSIDKVRLIKLKERSLTDLKQQYSLLKENIKSPWTKIALPTQAGFHIISMDDIIYCQSDSNYTNVYLKGGNRLIVSKTLKKMNELLNPHIFIRVHNSYIINKNEIKKFSRGKRPLVTLSDGIEVSVSISYKVKFMKEVKGK